MRNIGNLVVFFAILAAYLVGIPYFFADSPYHLGVATTASTLGLISLGVWLTFHIGRINIGQGAFALIGGYVLAILSARLGWSFWISLPLAGVITAALGVVIGWPILRLRGVYFAMLTLCLTEAVRLLALNGGGVTQGALGIVNIPTPGALSLFGFTLIPAFKDVNQHLAFFYLAAGLLIAGYLVIWRITRSRLGWIFRSLQQNEDLATSIGINIAKYRVIAYAICCFLGGLGGAFFTAAQQSIYPTSFTVPDSVYFMLYCFLGGLGYTFGPIIGAFVLFLSFEALHSLQQYQTLIYAGLIIALMLWLPNGLLSLRLWGGAPAARSALKAG
ncbi:MAG: branched-chain amino acid ABC transporter permease [Gammaproteobacteria bacterium]